MHCQGRNDKNYAPCAARLLRPALLIALLAAACSSDRAGPRVQDESLGSFNHFVIDARPPGGEECCTDVIAVGDINGDGYGDVVIGSEHAKGAGLVWYEYPTWQRHDIGEGQFTTDGLVVDFDGDDDRDIIVGDTSRGLVLVENLDHGLRWSSRVLVPEQYAHDLDIGDLDGDGDLDVAVADKKAVRLYFVDDLAVAEAVTVMEKPGEGLQIADLDRDGDLDILYSHFWLERRESEWLPHDVAPSWPADTRIVAADMNADGNLDVVLTGSEGDAGVSWFEAPAAATMAWTEHSISENPLNGVHSLGVADLDGDSLPDVLAAEMHTSPDRRILVFRPRDNGWEALTLALHGSHNMIVTDIDADGDKDLVGKNYAGPVRLVEYWENRSADLARVPAALRQSPAGWEYRPVTMARPDYDAYKFGLLIADINDDGRPEVVAGGTAYLNSGKSQFTEWPVVTISRPADIVHVLPAAQNGWRQALAVDETSLLLLSAASADGKRWEAETLAPLPPGRTQGYAASARQTDGSYDFYFTRGTTLQRLHIASGSPEDWPLTQLRNDVEESGVALADLDADGDTDVIGVEASGKRLMLLEADNGELHAHKAGASLHWIDRVEVADLDRDGRLDIVYTEESPAGRYDTHVRWLEAPANPWQGNWQPRSIVTLRSANSLDVRDVNGDGNIDVVIAEHTDLRSGDAAEDNFTGVFLNRGDASWEPETVEIGPHSSHLGARTADLDGDGDLDIVSIGWQQTCCVHAWVNSSEGTE